MCQTYFLLQSYGLFELKAPKHSPGEEGSNYLRECCWLVGGEETAYQFEPELLAHPKTLCHFCSLHV